MLPPKPETDPTKPLDPDRTDADGFPVVPVVPVVPVMPGLAEPGPSPRLSQSPRVWVIAGAVFIAVAVVGALVVRAVTRSKGAKTAGTAGAVPASPCGCLWPGTACVGNVCELAPKASWSLTPLRVSFAAPSASAAPNGVVMCSRPTGTRDWKCTKPATLAGAPAAATVQQASFSKDAAAGADLVVTTEALRVTGIDVEVRRDATVLASATALHHPLLRPGPMLFSGGLRFGDKDKGLNDALFKLSPVE